MLRSACRGGTTRKQPRNIASKIYRRRNVIERWFARLKQFRRIASRYDKTRSSYLGFNALCLGFIAGASQVALSGWGA